MLKGFVCESGQCVHAVICGMTGVILFFRRGWFDRGDQLAWMSLPLRRVSLRLM